MDATGDPQLRSLQQKVQEEHRELARVLERARRGLERFGDLEEAAEAISRLRDEFEAHLAQEEQLYYPPIWAVRPKHKSALQEFIAAHDHLRRLLDHIEDHLDRGHSQAATDTLDALTREFADHEQGEEQLLNRITREISAPAD